jgi:hypothetical protein
VSVRSAFESCHFELRGAYLRDLPIAGHRYCQASRPGGDKRLTNFHHHDGTKFPLAAYVFITRDQAMLVERGMKVMNVEAVGDAYAIASNYLRKSGAIPDTYLTNDRLLEIIVQMFHRGEANKLRLANKAITQFQLN